MTDKLGVEVVDDAVLVMTLRRSQKKNAVDMDMLRGLAAAYTRLSEDTALRCGVLNGEGDVFCAGLDLADVLPRMAADGPRAFLEEGQTDPFGLYGPPCDAPVIVAAQGRCYTAGLELTLAADMCVAAAGTVFGQQETRRGIFPFGGATLRLPHAIGWHNAMRIMLAGDKFTAEEAFGWGLVQELCDPGTHVDRALALAHRVTESAPLAVRACLRNARLAQTRGAEAAIEHIQLRGREIALTEDAREGMQSLMEKREPVFKGR